MFGSRGGAGTVFAVGVAIALVASPGCGTDAHGVEDCRSIERARCAAASHCTTARGAPVVSDVDSCQRFYRDQCLHGTASSAPDAAAADDCVSAIRAAGDCAAADSDTQDALCTAGQTPDTACDLILKPELLEPCRFLSPQGGSTGTGGGQTAGSGANDGANVGGGGTSAG